MEIKNTTRELNEHIRKSLTCFGKLNLLGKSYGSISAKELKATTEKEERIVMIQNGVLFPEVIELNDQYIKWKKDFEGGLRTIEDVERLGSCSAAFSKVCNILKVLKGIDFQDEKSKFCSRQLDKIRFLGFNPYNYAIIFNAEDVDVLHVIFNDPRLMCEFTRYVIHGEYLMPILFNRSLGNQYSVEWTFGGFRGHFTCDDETRGDL